MNGLRRQEPIGAGLRRIVCEQVETAIRCLTRQTGQVSDAYGAVRAAEAALALIEPDLPRPTVRRDRALINRLGAGLQELTEPAMLLAQAEQRYKKSPSDGTLADALKALRKKWSGRAKPGQALSSRAGSFNPAIYRIVADMAELRGHAGDWPTDTSDSAALPRGLRRGYNRALRAIDQPINKTALPELINALRQLELQLAVLTKCCPGMIKAQRKLLSKTMDQLDTIRMDIELDGALSRQLGQAGRASAPKSEPIDRRVRQVLDADGAAALAETTAAFHKRLQAYWSAWRA